MTEVEVFDALAYRIEVDVFGTRKYHNSAGQIHRTDGPAIEWSNGDKSWYQNGQLHRTDGPAVEYADGTKRWYINDVGMSESVFNQKSKSTMSEQEVFDALKYRVEVSKYGTRHYYNNAGQLHRTDGAAVEWADGDKHWFHNGQRHRTDGPAVEWANGTKEWHQHGQLHRIDGPAIEFASGFKAWYINGEELTEAEFNQRVKNV